MPAITVQAQELSTAQVPGNYRAIDNGWWCPESRQSIPHLQISTGDQIHLSGAELISPAPEMANYRSVSLLDHSIGNHPGAGLRLGSQRLDPGPLLEAELSFQATFLSPLQPNYTAWESWLEDSEPRVNVNGLLVYPLLQVNYAGWHLPISLYIPPLRGSDTRP